jgi:hypothetical protein
MAGFAALAAVPDSIEKEQDAVNYEDDNLDLMGD